MPRAALSLTAAISIAFLPHPALAATCAPLNPQELRRSGDDVTATGVVDLVVPLGFVLAVDRVYVGNAPAHVLVFGKYQPGSPGTRHYVLMRPRLPGVYTMDECDGQPMPTESLLGPLGDGKPPSADLPLAQAAAIAGALLALLLIRRGRGAGSPPAATATAY